VRERLGVSVGDVVLESRVVDDEDALHAVTRDFAGDGVDTLADDDGVAGAAGAARGLLAGLDAGERGLRDLALHVLGEN
jgi:hypothetical protein